MHRLRLGRFLAAFLAFVLVLSACSSADDPDGETSAGTEASDAPTDSESEGEGDEPAETEGSASSSSGPVPGVGGVEVVSVDYASINYDDPPAGSALQGDRDNPAYPTPLIEPVRIVPVIPADSIRPIDEPQYASIADTDFLEPKEGLVVVEVNDEVKAFPLQIMIWHEIVNDEIGGVPVSVTYCPLCNSALAFDRRVGDRILDFGTSGALFQSALVMYDRQTESLWAHFTGEGIVGHYAGLKLSAISVQTLSFERLSEDYPEALILTRDTGTSRPYGNNPYVGYDEESSGPIGGFFDGDVDPRLQPKTRVVGFVVEDMAYAADLDQPEQLSVVDIEADGAPVVIFQHPGLASALDDASIAGGRDVGQTGVFVPESAEGDSLTFSVDGDEIVDNETGSIWTLGGTAVDGPLSGQSLTPVAHLNTFWFAWSTYHPETAIISE